MSYDIIKCSARLQISIKSKEGEKAADKSFVISDKSTRIGFDHYSKFMHYKSKYSVHSTLLDNALTEISYWYTVLEDHTSVTTCLCPLSTSAT